MQRQRVGNIAPTGAESACNCGRNATTHTARCGMLYQHHKRESERHAGERVRAKTAEKQAVEGDHACNREQVEDIRRREPEKRRQDRPFEQQSGSPRNRTGVGSTGRGDR